MSSPPTPSPLDGTELLKRQAFNPNMPVGFEPYPGYNDEYRGHWILITCTLFNVLSTVLIALRLWARHAGAGLRADDWLCFSGVLFCLLTNSLFLAMLPLGLGHHISTIDHDTRARLRLIWWVLQQMSKFSVHLTRVSLLVLYMRIFSHLRWFRQATIAVIVLTTIYFLISVGVGFGQCTPVAYGWEKRIPGGYCVSTYAFFIANTVQSLIADVVVLVMPLPLIWRLQLPMAQKAALMPVFGLGVLIVVSDAIKLYTISALERPDQTYDLVGTICTIVEYNVAVICATLPSLRLVLAKCFPRVFRSRLATTTGRSGGMSGVGLSRTGKTGGSVVATAGGWTKMSASQEDHATLTTIGGGRMHEASSEEYILEPAKGIRKTVTVQHDVQFTGVDK